MIDPTCSIVLERQPAEKDVMDRPPRNPNEKLLTAGMALKSLFQGLVVFAASFGTYYYVMKAYPGDTALARTMGLSIILICNVLLVLVNSSEREFMFRTMKALAKDKVMWGVTLGTLGVLLVILYTPLSAFLKLTPLTGGQFLWAAVIACVAVLWYEIVKLVKKAGQKKKGGEK
jgi:Ca2+-transporting ATPase